MPESDAEQAEAMEEKLKNMSPEELNEFQKQQCIFCHIVRGDVQSKKVYEDDKVLAILDINPANPGHILLLPKEHYSIMPQIPDDEIGHLFMISKALSNAILKTLKAEEKNIGTSIFVANGLVAGQKAQHFMIHIIPRKENDGVGLVLPKKETSEENLNILREKVVERVNELFGIKKEEPEEEGKPREKIAPEVLEVPEEEKPKKEEEIIPDVLKRPVSRDVEEEEEKPKKKAREKPKKKPKEEAEEEEKEEEEPEEEEADEEGISLDDIAEVINR